MNFSPNHNEHLVTKAAGLVQVHTHVGRTGVLISSNAPVAVLVKFDLLIQPATG